MSSLLHADAAEYVSFIVTTSIYETLLQGYFAHLPDDEENYLQVIETMEDLLAFVRSNNAQTRRSLSVLFS